MRLLHITNSLSVGGTQKQMQLLTEELSSRGHDIIVVGMMEGGDRKPKFDRFCTDVYTSISNNQLRGILRENEIDIFHIHSMPATSQDLLNMDEVASIPGIIRSAIFGWPVNSDIIDRSIFPSKMTLLRYLLLNNYSVSGGSWKDKYNLIYPPIRGPMPKPDSTIRETLDIDDEVVLFGKIGRQAPSKWSTITLKAFAELENQADNCELVLVTPPDEVVKYARRYGITDKVHTIGKIPPEEINQFYHGIDVLAHSSKRGESFGYVLAEAMAAGTPVIVNSTPMRDNAQAELIQNGKTGYISGGVNGYTQAMSTLAASEALRDRFQTTSVNYVRKRLNVNIAVDELEEVYRSTLDGKSSKNPKTNLRAGCHHRFDGFQTEYERRMSNVYGKKSKLYKIEYNAWKTLTRSPFKKEFIYRIAQEQFVKLDSTSLF